MHGMYILNDLLLMEKDKYRLPVSFDDVDEVFGGCVVLQRHVRIVDLVLAEDCLHRFLVELRLWYL